MSSAVENPRSKDSCSGQRSTLLIALRIHDLNPRPPVAWNVPEKIGSAAKWEISHQ